MLKVLMPGLIRKSLIKISGNIGIKILFHFHFTLWFSSLFICPAQQKHCNSSLPQAWPFCTLRNTKDTENKRRPHFCLHRFLKRKGLPSGWKSDKTSQEGLGPSAKLNSCGETTWKPNHSAGVIYCGWLAEIITKRSSSLLSAVAAQGLMPDICKAPFSGCGESFTWDIAQDSARRRQMLPLWLRGVMSQGFSPSLHHILMVKPY